MDIVDQIFKGHKLVELCLLTGTKDFHEALKKGQCVLHLVINLPLGLVCSFYPLQPLDEHVVNDDLVVLLSLEGGHLRDVAVMNLRYVSIHLAHIFMEVLLIPFEVLLAHMSMLF